MNGITAGLDKLNLTFPTTHTPQRIIGKLFDLDLDFDKHFRKYRGKRPRLKWYGTSYDLTTTEGDVLAQFHTDCKANFGNRNLLTVNGLAFSDSALNALRPLDLDRLLNGAADLTAHVTAFDCYIDDRTGLSPVTDIYDMSAPHRYRDFIRSPFVKDHQGKPTIPRPYGGTSLYFGKPGRSSCEVLMYDKRLSPGGRIYEEGNALKHPWTRYELRLQGATAQRQGADLLYVALPGFPENKTTLSAEVVKLFRKFFGFVGPKTSTRPDRRKLQPWWSSILDQAATYNHIGCLANTTA